MRLGQVSRVALGLILVSVAGVGMAGDNLYRWTDAQGVVHFSDRAPDSSDRPVETRSMPKSALPDGPVDDTYSIVNQVERMRAERRQRVIEQRQAYLIDLEERRRLAEIAAAEARARQLEAEAQRASEPIYTQPWGWSAPRPHHQRPPIPVPPVQSPSPPSQMSLRRPGRSLKPVGGAQVPQQ